MGVVVAGGLDFIFTARHAGRRVDRRLFGRDARQETPGSCDEILSLKDDIACRNIPQWDLALLQHAGGQWADLALSAAQRRADKRSVRQRLDLAQQEARSSQRLAVAGAEVALREGSAIIQSQPITIS